MKIKHEHIREALIAWADGAKGEKVPAGEIADAWFALNLSGLDLHGSDNPEALSRNTQKIYRWAKSDSRDSKQKMQRLLPAIEKAMPVFLLAQMRSHSSDYYREMLHRKQRVDDEMEALFGAMIAISDRIADGGSSGNTLIH